MVYPQKSENCMHAFLATLS